MNGYQFASTVCIGITAIIIGWIYAPSTPPTPNLSKDLEACGELPDALYTTQEGRFGPTREHIAVPEMYQIKTEAIEACRDKVIELWKSKVSSP